MTATITTQSPWVARKKGLDYIITHETPMLSSLVATVNPKRGIPQQANAALIAAAPELLDCCERILNLFPELDRDEPLSGADVIDALTEEWNNLKYTIKKAKTHNQVKQMPLGNYRLQCNNGMVINN